MSTTTHQGAVGAETMTAAERVCHEEQMVIWSGEMAERLFLGDWLREHLSYEDKLGFYADLSEGIREIVESALDLATPAPRTDGGMTAGEDAGAILEEACKPWEFSIGEPPEYGSPLHGVFVAGMIYTERLLASLLSVSDYEQGDGSEDFDADATQSLRNILTGAGLWDADENCPVAATPAQPAGAVPDGLRALSEAASKGRFKVVRGLHDYAVVPEAREQKGPLNSADADFAAASANHIRDILASHPAGQSAGSGAETDALVDRFSAALKVKLRAAEAKYGWKNGWLKSNWQVECQNGLLRHVGKGDPLDVAAYAAFCWHHGWPSASRRSTDFVTGAVIPTAGAIAAYETRYPEGSLSETSDNAIEAWNRVAAAVCLAEKPAPDSTRTDQVGVAVEQAVAKAAERAVEQLENAASGGLFHCEADREEAVEIVTEAIWTSPLAARPAAPEAQGADDLAERLRREIGEIRTMAADPENKAAFCELTVVADNLEALLPAPPSSGQGGR